MKADAAPINAIAASREPRLCAPNDERDRVIDTIARLLSSGQRLPDILQNIKRDVEGTHTEHPNGAPEPDGQTLHVPGELRDTRSGSETIRPLQPDDAILADEGAQSSGAVARAAAAVAPGALDGLQSLQAATVRRTWHIKLSGLLQAALLSIIPAASLAVVAVAGKSLIGSDAVPNTLATAAKAITEAVQSSKNHPVPPSAEADKTATSRPDAEPAVTKPETVQPDQVEPQATTPDHADAQKTPPDRADPQTAQPDRGEPQLTSMQIRALVARGDALVISADVGAARLSYERAATAGNAEAALRLGATYDPAFLARAGLRNVRGDATIAQYWYRRARDLERDSAQQSSSEARN